MIFSEQHERLKYRFFRQLKNVVWFADYGFWLFVSPYKWFPMPQKISSVLVVEDCGLGDLLVSTPVFRALKKRYGFVTVLVKGGMEDVLKGNPSVDRVITSFEGEYDLGVILHARTHGNWKMSKILREHCRFRIGCTRVGFREGRGFFLHRKTFPTFAVKKKEQDNLDVIRAIGLDEDSFLEAYTDFMPTFKGYVVFHTHGAYETHNWYVEKWVALAQKIKKPIVFTGVNKDYVQKIISQLKGKKVVDATKTSIPEFFGWIKHADQIITVDTSAMHVASAFNRPVVSLFGNGDPRIWKPEPLSAKSEVVLKGDCHSCHLSACALKDHRSMSLIEPEYVLKKMESVTFK